MALVDLLPNAKTLFDFGGEELAAVLLEDFHRQRSTFAGRMQFYAGNGLELMRARHDD